MKKSKVKMLQMCKTFMCILIYTNMLLISHNADTLLHHYYYNKNTSREIIHRHDKSVLAKRKTLTTDASKVI